MSSHLTEDNQVLQTTTDCLQNALGWKSVYTYSHRAGDGTSFGVRRDQDGGHAKQRGSGQEKIVTVKVNTSQRNDTLRFDLAYWQEGGTVMLAK